MARDESRKTFLLARGNFLNPTRELQPGTPAVLHPLEVERPTRLDFGRWLVSRRSPTAARAIVNRIWQSYFGFGLVATSEDFGLQGESPSHRELLDWLAVDFMDRGWKLKDLHRLIAHSATYRQSAQVNPELLARDPQNRLLARGSRLPIGSRSGARPGAGGQWTAQPGIGRTKRSSAGSRLFVSTARQLRAQDLGRGARTESLSAGNLYLSVSIGSLSDAASLRRSGGGRGLRAPGPFEYSVAGTGDVERAAVPGMCPGAGQADAGRGGSNDADRLAFAFKSCVGRTPDEDESRVLLTWLDRQRKRFAREPAAALTLATGVVPAADATAANPATASDTHR